MGWSIEYGRLALRHLKKLDRSIQVEILDYMDSRIATAANPRNFGKPLRHDKYGLWALSRGGLPYHLQTGRKGYDRRGARYWPSEHDLRLRIRLSVPTLDVGRPARPSAPPGATAGKALAVSRAQQTRSFELRAALDLAASIAPPAATTRRATFSAPP